MMTSSHLVSVTHMFSNRLLRTRLLVCTSVVFNFSRMGISDMVREVIIDVKNYSIWERSWPVQAGHEPIQTFFDGFSSFPTIPPCEVVTRISEVIKAAVCKGLLERVNYELNFWRPSYFLTMVEDFVYVTSHNPRQPKLVYSDKGMSLGPHLCIRQCDSMRRISERPLNFYSLGELGFPLYHNYPHKFHQIVWLGPFHKCFGLSPKTIEGSNLRRRACKLSTAQGSPSSRQLMHNGLISRAG